MERYQRILVCIEEPERDYRMLPYVGAISRAAKTKEIHLLNVEPVKTELPEELILAQPEKPKITREALKNLAAEHLQGHGDERVVGEAVTGMQLIEILRYAHEKDVDLIVIGRQTDSGKQAEHEATLARRVTRKATCSVLVLPGHAPPKADKILVPVRNSECSANALEIACEIAVAFHSTVVCLNVFEIHSGYASVGTTLEEHTAIMEKWANRECTQLRERSNTGTAKIENKCIPDLYGNPVPIILEEEEKEKADMIVIGARGRTGAAGVLLGAVTEKLIQKSRLPLLAVKKKGECIGLLKALLTLAG